VKARATRSRRIEPAAPPARAAAILLAAGRGRRMAGAVDDKVLAPLAGQPVLVWSLEAFHTAAIVDTYVIVYRDAAQRARLVALVEKTPVAAARVLWVRGGAERQDSVLQAIEALPADVARVFIHDCARPLVHPESLRHLDAALARDGAACLAQRVTDTIKRLPEGAADATRQRLRTLDRSRLWAMQTPQAFERALIARAYRIVHRRRLAVTDDAAAVELATRRGMTLVENPHPNPKLTTPADLRWAEYLLRQRFDDKRAGPAARRAR
jgi:2-C-methyl-D-erythritol 4-phosphate cytidylyltransferase